MSMRQPAGGRGYATHGEEASKLKQRFDWLESFSDDELGQLVFLQGGQPLKPDEEYFDISNPGMGVFHGSEGETASESSRFVPKSGVPDNVWHKLVRPFK